MHEARPMADCMMKKMKFQKMPLYLLPMSQDIRRNNGNFCLTIHKTQYLYKAWSTEDFMMKMMKFRKMPLLLLPMSQNKGKIMEISQIATQKICIAVPNEGNK